MKKALACIAVLLLALAGFGGTKTFTIGSVTPACGGGTSPAVSVDDSSGLTSVSFKLYYDTTVLTAPSCTPPATWSASLCAVGSDGGGDFVTATYGGPAMGPGIPSVGSITFNVPGTLCDGDSTALNLDAVLYNTTESGTAVDGSCVVSCPANVPPGAATGPNPADAAVCQIPSSGFPVSWTAVTGATSYTVYAGTSLPLSIVGTTGTLTVDIGAPSVGTTYFWRVDPANACGTTTGTVWSFTTTPAAPAAPINPTPTNGATGVALTNVVLDWDDSAGATSYDVWFDGAQVANDILLSTHTVAGPLTASTTYNWYVIANGDCSQTTTGPTWSFTTLSTCAPPSSLTNNTAADGAACDDAGVFVSWAADAGDWGDGGAGTRTYDVLRDGSAVATALSYGTTDYTDTTGINGTTYLYQVRYNNGCGQSAMTTGAYAADAGDGLPGEYGLLAPPNGATGLDPAGVTLSWSPSANATAYDLYFGTDPSPALYQGGITTTASFVTGLLENTTYYWTVTAVSPCGSAPVGATWSFTTGTAAPPCTPVESVNLVSPPDGSTDVAIPVTLVWEEEPNADYYDVALGVNPAALAIIATTTATSVTVSDLAGGQTYYWRVAAVNDCSFANSALWSFTTVGGPAPGGAPLLIPGVASTTGDRASHWKTDVQIMNTGDETAAYTLRFIPADTDGTVSPHQASGTLAAGALKRYENIVSTVFGLTETAGALHIVGDQPLIAITRTYNDTGNGTYGQFVKGYGADALLGTPDSRGLLRQGETGHLVHLVNGEAFRTNVGFMEVTGQAATVTVALFDDHNTPLGSQAYPLYPMGFHQVNNIFHDLGVTGERPAARAEVTLAGGGAVLAYASLVDNGTNDAVFTVARKVLGLSSETVQTLPAAAHTHGAQDTFWRSDVRVYNPTAGAMSLTYTYRPVGGAAATRTINLPPYNLHYAADAVAEWFNPSGDTHGSLEIRAAAPLAASSRVYTGTEATYGQAVAPWRADEGVVNGARGIVLGLRADAAYRTNLGFTETAGNSLNLRIRIYDPLGNLLAERNLFLAARQHIQMNNLYAQLGLSGDREGYAVVEGTSGTGRAAVYASVVDNLTGDGVTIPAQ